MPRCPSFISARSHRYLSYDKTLLVAVCFLSLVVLSGTHLEARTDVKDLTELSIEDLMKIEVTSVSKRPQRVSDAAAAVFVITQEDIRRSGVTSIPEALRMAPGLEVARISSGKWAITSRGFNGFLANKLLVLMDGRSVYEPLFSGVYWDMQDTMMEDIERIEVIRGPGAALWGANAVNGVINIITRSAKDTQGGLFTAGTGTYEKAFGSIRYGTKIGEETYARAYAKGFDRGDFPNLTGGTASDAWQAGRSGFRVDSRVSADNAFTLQGDLARGHKQDVYVDPWLSAPYTQTFNGAGFTTGNLLTRWKHTFSDTSDLSFQAYYDYAHIQAPDNRQIRKTFDFDLQHRFALGDRQDIIWGLGYRNIRGTYVTEALLVLDPAMRTDELFSAFLQDDILLIKDRLHLVLGSKFEHNDYTGIEVQPSARFLWTPHGQHTVWGAVSRAVRTPSWGESFGRSTSQVTAGTPPIARTMVGNRGYKSEKVVAYELGYRFHPSERFSLDLAGFYNVYSDLRSVQAGASYLSSTPVTHIEVPLIGNNGMYGRTYGVELASDWKVLPWWRLQGAYTYLQTLIDIRQNSQLVFDKFDTGSPHNQVSLRSSFEVTKTVEFDVWTRYVDRIVSQNVSSYITVDLRLGWKATHALELSLVGQNLVSPRHQEFYSTDPWTSPTYTPRSVYGKMAWKF